MKQLIFSLCLVTLCSFTTYTSSHVVNTTKIKEVIKKFTPGVGSMYLATLQENPQVVTIQIAFTSQWAVGNPNLSITFEIQSREAFNTVTREYTLPFTFEETLQTHLNGTSPWYLYIDEPDNLLPTAHYIILNYSFISATVLP